MDVSGKERLLRERLQERGSMLIACSGGVDSSLLAAIAREVLGDRTRAAILDSPLVPRRAIRLARETADRLGIPLEIIPVPIMEDEPFRKNPPERCYLCRKITSRVLTRRAADLGLARVADGTSCSDLGEHRPGIRASDEEGILHPFVEAGITKADIRNIARDRGYGFWDRPPAACLASRIPYGDEITGDKLRRIEAAEEYLHRLGFTQLRVRLHGPVARIEVIPDEMERFWVQREEIPGVFRSLGFRYVTLDLEGFRSGSLDEVP